ncbi:hypothetical protein SAMN05421659_1058 [[Clostridium] fimetarium]|uniref:Uncharacterized protein n=1 Tax=[Clostridium] fimetarium TaxID=99656 RepID=A0A1I0PDH0_9FIRM|nr:hypothetical protein SAMN05421659_1058 [[Clostridium] fimetarium]
MKVLNVEKLTKVYQSICVQTGVAQQVETCCLLYKVK